MIGLSVSDRPNAYIGRSVPRPNMARLLHGRGHYASDLVLSRMVHVVFVRSPYAHARILRIDGETARAMPGVTAVATGAERAAHCTPSVGVLSNGRAAVRGDGEIIALEIDDLSGIGPYPMYRRTSAIEANQISLRPHGVYRGICLAAFVEITNPSAAFYGVGGARISSQDGVAVRLDAAGTIVCQTSITEQDQGAEAVTAQVVATVLGVRLTDVRVISGDTDVTPYGGGTWASRAASIGGEATDLDIRESCVVDFHTGLERMTLAELARVAYVRPDTLPPGFQAELMAERHDLPRKYPFAFTNGIQASHVEVGRDAGMIRLLGFGSGCKRRQ